MELTWDFTLHETYEKKTRFFARRTANGNDQGECTESTSVRSGYGTCSQTTVQTIGRLRRLEECETKRTRNSDRPAGGFYLAHMSPSPLVHATPLDKGHAIWRRSLVRRYTIPPGLFPSNRESKKEREWDREKLIRINECSHTGLSHLS